MCFHVVFKEEIVLEKPQLPWKGKQDMKPSYRPTALSAKLRAGLPEPGQPPWFRWFLIRAISIQRMYTHAHPKSMKSREENWNENVTKSL